MWFTGAACFLLHKALHLYLCLLLLLEDFLMEAVQMYKRQKVSCIQAKPEAAAVEFAPIVPEIAAQSFWQ